MNALTSATREDLDALVAAIDKLEGYPRAGVDIGAGIHAPPDESITLHHVSVRKHPDTKVTAFALPVDAKVSKLIADIKAKGGKTADEQKIAALADAAPLDETWTPKLSVSAEAADAEPK